MTKPTFRVPLGELGPGKRLVLEMEANVLPISLDLAGHLDDIRTMLLRGAIGPAMAHTLLLKAIRLNREKLFRMVDNETA